MTRSPDRGASTAEYTVGTLGAATIALVLLRLGADGGSFIERCRDLLEQALRWQSLTDFMPALLL